jgi:hypothetical protein
VDKGYNLSFSGADNTFHRKFNEDSYKMFIDNGFDTIIAKQPETASKMIGKFKTDSNRKTAFIDSLLHAGSITSSKHQYF